MSRPVPPEAAVCNFAPSPSDLSLFILGHYEAETLSSTWLGNSGKTTSVADIEILPGAPIHLVITAYESTIYRFSGATERISRLTLMSSHGAGVIGISRERVEFASPCLSHRAFYSNDGSLETILRLFGKPAHAVAGTYGLWRARVGDEIEVIEAPRILLGTDPESRALSHYSPGGVVRVDANSVVSNWPFGAYRVLPQEAGVRQLVWNGSLVRATEADVRSWEAAARIRGYENSHGMVRGGYGVYRVTRPIEIPAGLCGAHLIHLYAPAALVEGHICHVTIFYDDGTGIGTSARPRRPPASPPILARPPTGEPTNPY